MAELLRVRIQEAGRDGGYALEYRPFGSVKTHRHTGDGRGSRSIDSYVMQGDEYAQEQKFLPLLFKSAEVVHPPLCEACVSNEQMYLWRTFTDRSWNTFVECGFSARPLDESAGMRMDEGGVVFPKADLHEPGIIWTAKDVRVALSVGLSRKMCDGEDVRLVGMPVCQHTLDSGMRMWDVRQVSRGERKVVRLDMNKLLSGQFFFSDGIIVDRIPEETLRRSLVYAVRTGGLRKVVDMVERVDREKVDMTRYLYNISNLLGSMLHDLSELDPRYEDSVWCLNRITPPLRSLVGKPHALMRNG